MDSAKLILTEPVSPPVPLEHLQKSELQNVSEEKRKQIAKDFESVLINKMLDEMKNTIGSWGFEKDGPSDQVQGIFWLYLARDIGNKGGIGLWKDIYQFINNADHSNTAGKSLDGQT
jgi:Rod binding domain-containing protein